VRQDAISPASSDSQRFRLFYDGDCPLCAREIALLRRLDRRGHLDLVDIAAPGFDGVPDGLDHGDLMARIHGQLPDGRVVEGMEVFRRAYGAVGWGWLLAPTAWPGVRVLANAAYRWFARHRLRLTGRRPECVEQCATGAATRSSP
jgi:predicted DCC family thiol-disulfide oxidoreductase YuxK